MTQRKDQYCYDYPRMAVTADIVLLRPSSAGPEILLIRRKHEPFRGQWALPGGFVDMVEPAEDAARRELQEETGVAADRLTFIGYFDAIGRDPRGRTLSLAFRAAYPERGPAPAPADDAEATRWFALDQLPPLAFDHDRIIAQAMADGGE